MPAYKVKKYNYGEEQKIPLERNLHAYKYDTFFGISDLDRKPTINPPEPKRDEGSDIYIDMYRVARGMFIAVQILPIILKKYPELSVRNKDLAGCLKIITKYTIPIIDDRWDRSWLEWMRITEYAKAHGPNAASRKFYAIKDGKKRYLLSKHIKQKINEVEEFDKQIEKNEASFKEFGKMMSEIISNDEEIKKEYIRLANECDKNIRQIISPFYNFNSNSSGCSKIYWYTYYYLRHYDANVYLQRKSDYKNGTTKKSKVTGKIECGPFKKEDFPPGAIERLRLQTSRRKNFILLYMKIIFILSFKPFTSLSIHRIIGTETKDTINSMLQDLIKFGLVTELNESYAASDTKNSENNNNLYYSLNWSNPKTNAMLADYQKKIYEKTNIEHYE